MQFPLSITFDELSELALRVRPNIVDEICPSDDDESRVEPRDTLHDYIDPCTNFDLSALDPDYDSLLIYLHRCGFVVFSDHLEIRDLNALHLANALFNNIMTEYDEDKSPTWDLFRISGDDSVDYYGTQPTEITGTLLLACDA